MALQVHTEDFVAVLRLLNTNVNGNTRIGYALTAIKGVGRRFSILCCKKAEISLDRRAGTLNAEEIKRLTEVLQAPEKFKIPIWFLNRKKDPKEGKNSQLLSNQADAALRDDLIMLGKIRQHRGLRHAWGLRVRGQHTKTTGRRGRTVGVSKKKG
eukprot:NODE_7179_length_602_cov_87.802105_g7156_i0.p2 GENE.NODE_7179_length_602_cov_87.802105_g7156_i0~~NODE_7179_length_602_cov_87.802105_g7156_i0.p2  ORF type:complete len:174 (+),score=47.82 NODE_7179_length_602_cov_87.802105_g7156_i0:58-522(+)